MLKILQALSLVVITLLTTACGGGGSPGAPFNPGPNANGQIQLGLFDSSNVANNLVTSASGLTARATVLDSRGNPAANVVVTFTLGSTIAAIQPTSGTALTNASGIAQVSLVANGGNGADTLTATATLPSTSPITATATFSVAPPPAAVPAAVNFVSASPSNNSIVIKGAGGNGRTEVALLTFSVVDSSNTGIPNRKVNFSIQNPLVSLVSTSGFTDATGQVTAAVNSGSTPTTVNVIATVDGTSISTVSNIVTVTTGLPTQVSFTVAREKANVEGIDFSNITNRITVLLADSNGGVVANGTPVVFTTDSGAIIGDQGTTDSARCLTGPPSAPGECSVTWRSQSPNKSVVTVTATSSNGTDVLSASTQFSNSASLGIVVSGLPAKVTFTCPTTTAQTFNVTITDRNGITAPDGTALTSVNATNGTLSIFPASVVAPANPFVLGTSHTLTVSPASTCVAGQQPASVTLQAKPPLGSAQTFPIPIEYR